MKKEKATIKIRVYPSVRRKLKIIAAENGTTISEVIKELLKKSK